MQMLPEGATALEIPSDRPASVCHFKGPDSVAAATAVHGIANPSPPDSVEWYHLGGGLDDPGVADLRRTAFVCITPSGRPCHAHVEPGAFIRRVFRTLALDLAQNFQLKHPFPGCADIPVIFRTPGDREKAVSRQPFQLDGVTVNLLPIQVILNAPRSSMVHVALHHYPLEQRRAIHTRDNCRRFGFVRDMDGACLRAPDLSTVRVVLEVEQPREIPRELRIYYGDGSTSIVPVEIVRVWEPSPSYNANGQFVPLFKLPSARPSNEDEARRILAILQYAAASGPGQGPF